MGGRSDIAFRVGKAERNKQALMKKQALKKQALKKQALMKKQALKRQALRRQALKKQALKEALKREALKKQALKKVTSKKKLSRAPLTETQQTLAACYLPLARALASPLKSTWPGSTDEFESAACLALVEAAQSYDPSRKVAFATFARFRIGGALRDVQRSLITEGWNGDLDHTPAFTSLHEDIEEHGRVLNAEPDRPVEDEVDALDAVERWLRKLPKKYAAACREIYINNQTQEQAAETIGCSKSRISYLLKSSKFLLGDDLTWKDGDDEGDDEVDGDDSEWG